MTKDEALTIGKAVGEAVQASLNGIVTAQKAAPKQEDQKPATNGAKTFKLPKGDDGDVPAHMVGNAGARVNGFLVPKGD